MGILNIFRRTTPSLPRLDHPVFGPIDATMANEDGSLFWQTAEGVATPRGVIGISFDGTADGPSQRQVELWTWIHDTFEALARSAEPLLLETLRDFNLEARFGELKWSGADLSPNGDRAGPWALSFELTDGSILTAHFEDEVPTVVSFDD
jgi:hypothetical protein